MSSHNAILEDKNFQQAMKDRRKHQRQTQKQERKQDANRADKVQRTDNKASKR